jgi:hypothetical protein
MSRPTEFADTKEGKIVKDLELSGGIILTITLLLIAPMSGIINLKEKTTNIYSRSDDDYWGFLIPFIPFTVGIGLIVTSKELEIYYKDKEYTDNQRLADAGITFTVLGVLGGLFLLFVKIINKWLYAIPLLLIIIGIVLIIVYKDDLPPR